MTSVHSKTTRRKYSYKTLPKSALDTYLLQMLEEEVEEECGGGRRCLKMTTVATTLIMLILSFNLVSWVIV